jgi:hypothetical protein
MTKFKTFVTDIESVIKTWEPKLSALPEDTLKNRRNSQNRTIKQILGHLIDSTSNNIHRCIHLQNQKSPLIFPNYASLGNNDRWIAIQDYQNEDWNNMIQLWKYSLLHLCHIVNNIDESKLKNEWIAGPDQKISLEEMIDDFFPRHFNLHLDEIDELITKTSDQRAKNNI